MMKYLIASLTLLLLLQACSRPSNSNNEQVVTVESHPLANVLFYSGSIQPLNTQVIACPADGVILDMPFQYGEEIKNGQMLFSISSTKFLSDYKTALMQYIKAKSDFNTSQTQLAEGQFLHKHLLISDDDYKAKQSSYYGSQLAMVQAKDALENLLQQLNIHNFDLNKLSIADIDKIKQAMHLQMTAQNLRIVAPTDGVILAPQKSEDENKMINAGDAVKQGDALAIIGDMSGISVRIKVNELVVNQLVAGQKVKITGIAFPDDILTGYISRVNRQGEGANNGLPSFTVEVRVPHLTMAQQKIIHVGMSAKVEIASDDVAQISVPFSALQEKNGETYVQLLDEKSQQAHMVLVKTGKTTLDSVAILSGLHNGDKIVIPN